MTINKNNEDKNPQNLIKNFYSKNPLNYNKKYNKIFTRKRFLSKEKERIGNKIKLKKILNNKNYDLGDNINDLTLETSLTNSHPRNSFLDNTIDKKYKKKLNIYFLKKKIDNLKSKIESNNKSNFSFSFPHIKLNDKAKEAISDSKKMIECHSSCLTKRIKNAIAEKINPIIDLNEKSEKKLFYIKQNHIKSKNEKKIKKIMRRKTIMGILRDKEYYKSLKNIKTPKFSNIELPNKYKSLACKNKYIVEFDN